MSVYCDPLAACVPSKTWPWHHSAHLFADTVEELHALAGQIGLKRAWFQDDGYFPHYDLTENKRRQAARAGVICLSRAEACQKWGEIFKPK